MQERRHDLMEKEMTSREMRLSLTHKNSTKKQIRDGSSPTGLNHSQNAFNQRSISTTKKRQTIYID